jgi:hypothetical protein
MSPQEYCNDEDGAPQNEVLVTENSGGLGDAQITEGDPTLGVATTF